MSWWLIAQVRSAIGGRADQWSDGTSLNAFQQGAMLSVGSSLLIFVSLVLRTGNTYDCWTICDNLCWRIQPSSDLKCQQWGNAKDNVGDARLPFDSTENSSFVDKGLKSLHWIWRGLYSYTIITTSSHRSSIELYTYISRFPSYIWPQDFIRPWLATSNGDAHLW